MVMNFTCITLRAGVLSLLLVTSLPAKEPAPETLQILAASPKAAMDAYREYAGKYAHTTPIGEAAMADSRAKWAALAPYAKALWDVYGCIEVGDSIFKYPGLLSHGSLSWDAEKKLYSLGLGFRPFNPRDGLGHSAVSFDLTGKITGKSKAKYPW